MDFPFCVPEVQFVVGPSILCVVVQNDDQLTVMAWIEVDGSECSTHGLLDIGHV